MKKIFLTAIALMAIASAQVFGMYGADSSWIDFLTHGNQFRARLQQLGFTLGNDTIRGTFGFHSGANGMHGTYSDDTNENKIYYNFYPTISMGLGYTSSLISVGVGYNATIGTNKWSRYNGKADAKQTEAVVHTPVLVLNALDNAFRMAFPIQILHLSDKQEGGVKSSVTAVSFDAQFRYYTGLEVLPQIRLYLKYGTYKYTYKGGDGADTQKGTMAESFGFDFRLYFGAVVEEVALQPFVKIVYDSALGKQHDNTKITAVSVLGDSASKMDSPSSSPQYGTAMWGTSPWELKIMPALGLTANSDIVSLYLEPSLGFQVIQRGDANEKNVKEAFKLAYDVYAEIYLRPIQNLEWYFETSIGNAGTENAALAFAASTGITWYLPKF